MCAVELCCVSVNRNTMRAVSCILLWLLSNFAFKLDANLRTFENYFGQNSKNHEPRSLQS